MFEREVFGGPVCFGVGGGDFGGSPAAATGEGGGEEGEEEKGGVCGWMHGCGACGF